MNMSLYPRRSRGRTTLLVVGWLLLLGLGIWLVWYGFTWTEEEQPEITPSPAMVSDASPQVTVWPTITSPLAPAPAVSAPTDMPLPTATPEPTSIPPTAIPTPYLVAGADGVNVRDGPAITYTRLGHLDPGAQAEVTGRDGDWWQILYNDAPGWVFAELVTAFDAEQIESPPATPTTQAEPPPAGTETWPTEVFQLINSARAEHSLPPYTYNEILELAAQLHGQDCQQRGECSHTGSDGSDVTTRILRAGYDAAGASEVIVYTSSPQEAVAWWMDETPPNDPHRSTLLSTWVTEIGVAVVPTGRDDYYFIAVFGRPNTS
ncbi:MAG: CAP domain-containing protein [Chloroflexota bacterium]|nr:CAP domain-containing protein [Chloroflexota bacterium]